VTTKDVEFLCESLKAKAIVAQREDPVFWESIPTGRPKHEQSFEEACWSAIKRYMLDDPELRDLPHNDRLDIERERDPEGVERRNEAAWKEMGLPDWRTAEV
jgi:hypothetical protein